MMYIKSFCVGDSKKSFYIDSFSNGVNIIHSDDNNKGKTIVTQGIMYALGNKPIFPKGFDNYNNYYFFVELIKDNNTILICRRKDTFSVIKDGKLSIYESVNSFKRFFNSNIYELPTIQKDNLQQLIGLELFIEMFFVPQDKRDTSNVFCKGRYTKEDFLKSIFSIKNCNDTLNIDEMDLLKSTLEQYKKERRILVKSSSFLKGKSLEASFLTYTASKASIDKKIELIEKYKSIISELITSRNRLLGRISKNEILLKEINSLNRDLKTGELVCLDCGSHRIGYESTENTVKFEISDSEIRTQIKEAIENRIAILKEDIVDYESKLIENQSILTDLLKDNDINMENLFFYKHSITDSVEIDKQIYSLDQQIADVKEKITAISNRKENSKIKSADIYNALLYHMNKFYTNCDTNDPLTITDLFTKSEVNYSGSQGAIYLMARIYACSKVLDIDFPIVIDHFRDGEISTIKEENVISLFSSLNKQIILTCTLKKEENEKYDNRIDVNAISFDQIQPFNLMSSKYNEKFIELIRAFSISI